ncbi:MAG TPA: sigma-70 family RNA polymerase sigma factor, partial [Blastocatellia bacterium]|nr:sigma-70 family RNA polymerase sigma factor [Blastocatellia bacterium]
STHYGLNRDCAQQKQSELREAQFYRVCLGDVIMALQSMLDTTQAAAPCGDGGVSLEVRRERSSRFAQDAKCGAAAGGSASALAETKLVAAAKKGDETAFRELVEKHKRSIYLRAFRIMGNSEDAADVTQSTLLKAFLHLNEFKGESSFSTWITRIAINEALMMRRRDRRGLEVPIDNASPGDDAPVPLEIADTRPNPEHSYLQLEWRDILNSALRALRPAMRLVLVTYGLDELTVRQTAEMLGITVTAAKSRISRGQRALREKIRQHLASASAA